MKKTNRIILLTIMAFMLFFATACGKKLQETALKLNQDGYDSVLTYYHDGDKVIKQTAKNNIKYASLGLKDIEDAKAKLEPIAEQYKEVDGIKYNIEFKEDLYIEELEMDYEKIDYDKARNLQGITLPDDANTDVSLKASIEYLEKLGYKKVEK